MADFSAEDLQTASFSTLTEAVTWFDVEVLAESLQQQSFGSLTEATISYLLNTNAELLLPTGANSLTSYYLMIGWDSILTSQPTVWQVTGSPDTTGASSGNPTINAATIRILKSWAA